MLTAEQIRAARGILRVEQQTVAAAIGVSIATFKRWEAGQGPLTGSYDRVAALQAYYESAGIIFIPGNGEGPGVRLRKPAE